LGKLEGLHANRSLATAGVLCFPQLTHSLLNFITG